MERASTSCVSRDSLDSYRGNRVMIALGFSIPFRFLIRSKENSLAYSALDLPLAGICLIALSFSLPYQFLIRSKENSLAYNALDLSLVCVSLVCMLVDIQTARCVFRILHQLYHEEAFDPRSSSSCLAQSVGIITRYGGLLVSYVTIPSSLEEFLLLNCMD